jgi:putative redox protein
MSYKVQSRAVSFPGSQGGLLAGQLDFPLYESNDTAKSRYVIISHCFTCSKQTLTTARLARALAQAGIACLRFDFTGLGDSEGSFADTTFHSMVEDVACAADFLAQHYQPAQALIGHSMGGTASLAASQQGRDSLSALRSLITLASPAEPQHVLHHFGEAMPLLRRGQMAQIEVAGQLYPVKPAFVEGVESFDMRAQMQNCRLPILAVSAGNDQLVAPQAASAIVDYTGVAHELLQIESADHLFSDRAHAQQLADSVIDWLQRH